MNNLESPAVVAFLCKKASMPTAGWEEAGRAELTKAAQAAQQDRGRAERTNPKRFP